MISIDPTEATGLTVLETIKTIVPKQFKKIELIEKESKTIIPYKRFYETVK